MDEFREVAKDVLSYKDGSKGIIVNYHMATLGQSPPYGHHSPLAAYHQETDQFLVLDTWYDTVEPWAKTDNIFNAMMQEDSASGRTRGFCVVDFTKYACE